MRSQSVSGCNSSTLILPARLSLLQGEVDPVHAGIGYQTVNPVRHLHCSLDSDLLPQNLTGVQAAHMMVGALSVPITSQKEFLCL